MRLGIVIPTLNEAANLPRTVASLRASLNGMGNGAPVVVADCGSGDGTVLTARRLGCPLVQGPLLNCRAAALNAGAQALGEWPDVLWFVHADTVVPPSAGAALLQALARPDVVAGAFDFAWQPGQGRVDQCAVLAVMRLVNMMRYRITRNYFGDQTLFVRRDAFEAVGGYPERALLEDISICRALRSVGRLTVARETVLTSPRRFVENGVIKQLAFDLLLLSSDLLGMEPASLYRRYNRVNRWPAR